MVNRWLKLQWIDVSVWDIISPHDSPHSKSRVNPTAWRRVHGQEVVLDRAIHGLLRVGDGKTCRGTLTDRSFWGIARRWSAHPIIGTREAPFTGDRYER